RQTLHDKVIEPENIEAFSEEEEFRAEPITNIKDIIWEHEIGNLRFLRLNEHRLAEILGLGYNAEPLKALNRFVLSCMRKGVDVKLSTNIPGLIAGGLYGAPVRLPSDYNPGL